MAKFDLEPLIAAGIDYQHHRAEMEDARERLAEQIPEALRNGVTQTRIVKLTGYTRERVRQIARAAGIGA